MDTRGKQVSALGNIREQGVCMCVSGERATRDFTGASPASDSAMWLLAALALALSIPSYKASGANGPKRTAYLDVVAGWRVTPELVQQRVDELGEVAKLQDGVENVFVRVNRTGRMPGDEENSLMASLVWSVSVSAIS